jgi:putative transposase
LTLRDAGIVLALDLRCMARPLRIEFPGALYHVTARGNAKRDIFCHRDDFRAFLSVITATAERYRWHVYAYCLMPNHYHLLAETPEANLSSGMRYLNGVYAQRFNRSHARAGHVFQGRFKAIIVDKESYLLVLSRYIVLNPVRVGLVADPGEWMWSSYLATLRMAPKPRFLQPSWILKHFDEERAHAIKAYHRFVLDGIEGDPPWKHLKNGVLLGGEQFTKSVEMRFNRCKSKEGIPKSQRFAARPSLDQIFARARKRPVCPRTVRTAQRRHGYSYKEIARFLDVHPSTITRALQRHRE